MAAQGFREALSNKTCQVCSANDATHFCDCKKPPTLFCFDCSIRHSGKDPLLIHQTIPIAALGRNLEDYRRKHNALIKGAAELRKNLERIDACCHEVQEMIRMSVNYLTEYGSWWVQYMHTEKEGLSAAIEAAVLETTVCLNQNTEPKSPLAWALWTLLPEEMQVVSYSVTTPDLRTLLLTCSSYQNNLQAVCERSRPVEEGSKDLVYVTSTYLCYFHCGTSTWSPQVPLRTQIQADWGSRWVMLEGRVFCCGGRNGMRGIATAYMLARDGAVEQKANMSKGRLDHGLIAINKTAYVFGGYYAIKKCEKWQENQWRNLPSMRQGRGFFNPCMFSGRVYLCGYPSQIVEAFVPQTDTFLPLRVTLSENTPCCLYVDNHLLVLHSLSYILKFAVESDGQLTLCSEVTFPSFDKYQNSQPVVDKANGVVYMILDGKCLSFAMETGLQRPTVALE